MRILLIGSGGREHAMCAALSKSPDLIEMFTAPGNPGTAEVPKNENVSIDATDLHALAAFASSEGIDLTVVGPEAPLSKGIVDQFKERGLKIFGPTQKAAQLESSKSFAKEVMVAANVPTAKFEVFDQFSLAKAYLEKISYPVVLKADGLAQGKGVVICKDKIEALSFAKSVIELKVISKDSNQLVVEEFMEGEEASYFVIADGEDFVSFTSAQDHKRLLDHDLGPNTGGMGAYSPAPCISQNLKGQIEQEVIAPTLKEMKKRGIPFSGFLYVGLMLTKSGPKVLEFNVRLGDPEAQAILPRLDSDLLELLDRAARGRLKGSQANFVNDFALTVVLASQGYPQKVITGFPISGTQEMKPPTLLFHAGTELKDGSLVTRGGRVLSVTGIGKTLKSAKDEAYQGVHKIHFEGCQFRTDIGWRAL